MVDRSRVSSSGRIQPSAMVGGISVHRRGNRLMRDHRGFPASRGREVTIVSHGGAIWSRGRDEALGSISDVSPASTSVSGPFGVSLWRDRPEGGVLPSSRYVSQRGGDSAMTQSDIPLRDRHSSEIIRFLHLRESCCLIRDQGGGSREV